MRGKGFTNNRCTLLGKDILGLVNRSVRGARIATFWRLASQERDLCGEVWMHSTLARAVNGMLDHEKFFMESLRGILSSILTLGHEMGGRVLEAP